MYYIKVGYMGLFISLTCFPDDVSNPGLSILALYIFLSYDVAVFQWITSCHKNRMTTRVITLLREYITSLTTSVTTM